MSDFRTLHRSQRPECFVPKKSQIFSIKWTIIWGEILKIRKAMCEYTK